jgi:UDP-N-acetylmuramyl tripeptide synthase
MYDKNLEMIRSNSIFCVFGCGQTKNKTYVQSFGSIAPAATKRALLMDDGRHVIA